jgi:predicted small secreted protein
MHRFTDLRRAQLPRLLALSLLAGAVLALGACNTVQGFGTDVSKTGNAVSNSAEKVKEKL